MIFSGATVGELEKTACFRGALIVALERPLLTSLLLG